MSSSNEGGTWPDGAVSNPSPITTTSAHDTSNWGDGGEDVEGVMVGVEVCVPERHNDFKGKKMVAGTHL